MAENHEESTQWSDRDERILVAVQALDPRAGTYNDTLDFITDTSETRYISNELREKMDELIHQSQLTKDQMQELTDGLKKCQEMALHDLRNLGFEQSEIEEAEEKVKRICDSLISEKYQNAIQDHTPPGTSLEP